MKYETDKWPFIEAKWYTKVDPNHPRTVDWVVIHAMQFKERPDSAEVIAHDFATRSEANAASAHINVDNNSIVQCVHDRDVAWGAKGANRNAIHIELAGFIEQTREQWMDPYGITLLANGANACAQYCRKFSLPPVHLTDAQLLTRAQKGVIGHDQVSRVFKIPGGHTDPGPGFPWDYFMSLVGQYYAGRKPTA